MLQLIKKDQGKLFFIWFFVLVFKLYLVLHYPFASNSREVEFYQLGVPVIEGQGLPVSGLPVNPEYYERADADEEIDLVVRFPGMLLPLMVGVPFYFFSHPIAVKFFLVIINMLVLAGLVFYLIRRGFLVSKPLMMLWIILMPATFLPDLSIFNFQFALSVLFFISLIELYPLNTKIPKISEVPLLLIDNKSDQENATKKIDNSGVVILPWKVSWLLLGFSWLALLQIHFSGFLLLPLVLIVILAQRKKKLNQFLKRMLFFVGGLILGGLTILPTLFSGEDLIQPLFDSINQNWKNANQLLQILSDILMLTSFNLVLEGNVFTNITKIINLALEQGWAFFFIFYSVVFGWAQWLGYMICLLFPTGFHRQDWDRLRALLGLIVITIWGGYFFHDNLDYHQTYLLFFPFSLFFSVYVLEWVLTSKWWSKYFIYLILFSAIGYQWAISLEAEKKVKLGDQRLVFEAVKNSDVKLLEDLREKMLERRSGSK